MDGILLIDKPKGWTSFDVVAKIRNQLRNEVSFRASQLDAAQGANKERTEPYKDTVEGVPLAGNAAMRQETERTTGSAGRQAQSMRRPKVKVGHTGTLDPLATGLLIIVTGSYCKRAQEFSKLDKVYEAELLLGQTSTTDDDEGEKTPYDLHQPACFTAEPQTAQASLAPEHFSTAILGHRTICTASCVSRRENAQESRVQTVGQCTCHIPDEKTVMDVMNTFVGEQQQLPPAFSAIKVAGQRAYKLARAGKEVVLEPRTVQIYSITDIIYNYPTLKFTVHVSSGTYIRSLARDIGEALGTGAYLSSLRRTQVGQYRVKDTQDIAGFSSRDIVPTEPLVPQ